MNYLRKALTSTGAAIYSVFIVVVWALYLIIGGAVILMLPGLERRRHVARRALRMMFASTGMPCHVSGLENVPDTPCVVIANHKSFLDGLVLIAALPPHFRPVIKQEMKKVPIIGRVLARIGSSFVHRTPVQRAGRDTLYIYDELLGGDSLAIFPEGAFSPDAGLLPFRAGAFLLAAKADVPVVPAAMFGTRAALPEGQILPRPARLYVDILEPIAPAGRDDAAVQNFRRRVEEALADTLKASLETRLDHGKTTPAADQRELLQSQPLPLAYLDIDRLDVHIQRVVEQSGGKDLRVDARTLQSPQIVERVLRSHARFKGALCSTAAEADRLLARQDITDVLIATPTLETAPLDRIGEQCAAGNRVAIIVDCERHVDAVADAARRADARVGLFIEIDVSAKSRVRRQRIRRSAVCDPDTLASLAAEIDRRDELIFRGVSIFDAAYESGADKRDRSRRTASPHTAIVEALRQYGLVADVITCNGGPALAVNAHGAHITELGVGDILYGLEPGNNDDAPAIGIAAEVMRQLDDSVYACLGGGALSAATDESALLPTPIAPAGAALAAGAYPGSNQFAIHAPGQLALGEAVLLRPASANELCARFDQLVLLQDNAIVGRAPTERVLTRPIDHDADR